MIHDLTYVKIRYHNTRLIENTWTHPGHIWILLEAYYNSWKHLDAPEEHLHCIWGAWHHWRTIECSRGALELHLRLIISLHYQHHHIHAINSPPPLLHHYYDRISTHITITSPLRLPRCHPSTTTTAPHQTILRTENHYLLFQLHGVAKYFVFSLKMPEHC